MSFENQQLAQWLAMAEVTAKRTIVKQRDDKVRQCKCLVCGGEASGERGLCVAHYFEFRRTLLALPKKDRPTFESEQIREGRILASGEIRKIKKPNPFTSEVA